MCNFNDSWRGQCKEPDFKDGFCQKHYGEKCSSCGAQATRSCGETGQFVCGCPLCDNCEHTTYSDGTNGMGFSQGKLPEGYKNHCKKNAQVYKPWYETELEKMKEKKETKGCMDCVLRKMDDDYCRVYSHIQLDCCITKETLLTILKQYTPPKPKKESETDG